MFAGQGEPAREMQREHEVGGGSMGPLRKGYQGEEGARQILQLIWVRVQG